jgi:hypothetical protein
MKEETILSKEYAEFLTVTCLEWRHSALVGVALPALVDVAREQ